MALIQKQAIQNYWDTARPSGLDIAYAVVATSLVLLALLLPTIFNHYNTFGAREVLASGAGNALSNFLLRIDQLSFTNDVVTFLLWGVIGMVVYGLISSLLRALAKAEQERELASDDYVHPTAFSRTKFWHEELLISAVSFVSFALFLASTAFVLLSLLPAATVHVRSLVTSGDRGIWQTAAAVVVLVGGSCLILLCYKLWRHRMVMFEES
jgi:uncharacterized membrane protein YhaH (DUF805 family)